MMTTTAPVDTNTAFPLGRTGLPIPQVDHMKQIRSSKEYQLKKMSPC